MRGTESCFPRDFQGFSAGFAERFLILAESARFKIFSAFSAEEMPFFCGNGVGHANSDCCVYSILSTEVNATHRIMIIWGIMDIQITGTKTLRSPHPDVFKRYYMTTFSTFSKNILPTMNQINPVCD